MAINPFDVTRKKSPKDFVQSFDEFLGGPSVAAMLHSRQDVEAIRAEIHADNASLAQSQLQMRFILEQFEGSANFARFYPKVYDKVDGYTSPKMIAALLMYIAVMTRALSYDQDHLPTICAVAYRAICDMVAHKVPIYFVTRELVAAAL